MIRKIDMRWKIMPLFYSLHKDSLFDNDYVLKGFTFVYSLILVPFVLPFYVIGFLIQKYIGQTKKGELIGK